jgi:hypothetical protein
LLNAYWWSTLKIWNQELVTPNTWVDQGKDPVTLAANMWVDETNHVLSAAKMFPDLVYRVKYRDLISNPLDTIVEILEFCNLRIYDRVMDLLVTFPVYNMNRKYKKALTQEQQQDILRITKPVLKNMCFELDNI